MQLKNGFLNHINKKVVVGTMSFVLLTTTLTGCVIATNKNTKNLFIKSNNVVTYKDVISYSTVGNNGYFVKVKNKKTDETYYTIGIYEKTIIYNLFTEEKLDDKKFEIEKLLSIQKYLSDNDILQDEYTGKELKDILDGFIQNKENKQKVKVK